MLDAFHDVSFPLRVALGARGGPVWRTEVVPFADGHEQRIARWQQSRRRYDAALGVRSAADARAVMAFFEARQGRRFSFRWHDDADFASGASDIVMPTDQALGTGDGQRTDFALVKTYHSGSASFQRRILLPVLTSVRVAVSGVETTAFNLVDGVVRLIVPAPTGAVVSAGFTFDVPARFDTDELSVGIDAGAIDLGEIPIVEVFG